MCSDGWNEIRRRYTNKTQWNGISEDFRVFFFKTTFYFRFFSCLQSRESFGTIPSQLLVLMLGNFVSHFQVLLNRRQGRPMLCLLIDSSLYNILLGYVPHLLNRRVRVSLFYTVVRSVRLKTFLFEILFQVKCCIRRKWGKWNGFSLFLFGFDKVEASLAYCTQRLYHLASVKVFLAKMFSFV